MWIWLRAHATDFYETYWYLRGIREHEFVFGDKPFLGLKSGDYLPEFKDRLNKYFKGTCTHWSQGKINPATFAWVIRQVEMDVQQNLNV